MTLATYFGIAIGILFQVADYYSTRWALKNNPKAYEQNPIVRKVGLLPAKLFGAGVTILGFWLIQTHIPATIIATLLIGIAGVYITFNNISVGHDR